jgi:hypothetical protein
MPGIYYVAALHNRHSLQCVVECFSNTVLYLSIFSLGVLVGSAIAVYGGQRLNGDNVGPQRVALKSPTNTTLLLSQQGVNPTNGGLRSA